MNIRPNKHKRRFYMKTDFRNFIRYGLALLSVGALALVMAACSSTALSPPAPTLSSLTVTPASPDNLVVGATQQFTVIGTYSDGSTYDITYQVTWASSDTSVATISSAGLATGVAAGTTGITASLSEVTSPAITLTVVPTPTLTSIAVTPESPENLSVGSTQQFIAIGTYSDGSTTDITSQATWSSSDTNVATISSSGLATGVAAGTTDITASLSGVTSPAITLTVA
jgi:uncharacterized protein YjlB